MKPASLRSIPPRFAVLYGAGVFALVFALHHSVLQTGFWADDFGFLRDVPPFSFRDLPRFVNPLWGWFYRPVYLIAFALMRRFIGDNAVAYHAASLVLHALNIVLLSALVWRVSQRWWPAVMIALAFLFHPLIYPHPAAVPSDLSISAVAWISSGSTLLAALFYLLTLHGWLSWRTTPRPLLYAGTLLCFALSLCSKEDALSLPFALLICELLLCPTVPWPQRLRFMLPFVVVGAGYLFLDATAYIHYKTVTPQAGMLHTGNTFGRLMHPVNFYERMFIAAYSMGLLWLNIICIAILGFVARQTSRILWAAWWWSIVVALPAPLAAGSHAYANRFFYLPVMAAAAFAIGAAVLWWQADDEVEHALGAVWIAALASWSLTYAITDPVTIWVVLIAAGIGVILCYHYQLLTLYPMLLIVLTMMLGQLDIFGPEVPPWFWKVVEMVVVPAFLWWRNKRYSHRIWYAIPTILLLWYLPASNYLVLILLLLFPAIQKSLTKSSLLNRYRGRQHLV